MRMRESERKREGQNRKERDKKDRDKKERDKKERDKKDRQKEKDEKKIEKMTMRSNKKIQTNINNYFKKKMNKRLHI